LLNNFWHFLLFRWFEFWQMKMEKKSAILWNFNRVGRVTGSMGTFFWPKFDFTPCLYGPNNKMHPSRHKPSQSQQNNARAKAIWPLLQRYFSDFEQAFCRLGFGSVSPSGKKLFVIALLLYEPVFAHWCESKILQ